MADETQFQAAREGGYRSSRTAGFATGPLDKVTGSLSADTTSEDTSEATPYAGSYDIPSATAGLAKTVASGIGTHVGTRVGTLAGEAYSAGEGVTDAIGTGVTKYGEEVASSLGFGGSSSAIGAGSTASEFSSASGDLISGGGGSDLITSGSTASDTLGAGASSGATTASGSLSEGLTSASNIGAGLGAGVLRVGIGLISGEKTSKALREGAYTGAGTYVGAAIGSVIPVVGTVLGGFFGGTIGSIFCFCRGTLVLMEDKTLRPIEEIRVGDHVALGGMVTGVGETASDRIMSYRGIGVDASHAMFEDGKWLRVYQSEKAEARENNVGTVFPAVTENHLLVILGNDGFIVASDLAEIEDSSMFNEASRLAIMNESTKNAEIIEKIAALNKEVIAVPYRDEMRASVMELYKEYDWNGVPKEALPSDGVVAIHGGKIIGAVFVWLAMNANMAAISLLVVDQDHTDKRAKIKAADALIEKVFEIARNHVGANGLITTFTAHKGAQALYHRHGMVTGENDMSSLILPVGGCDFDFMTPDEEGSHV